MTFHKKNTLPDIKETGQAANDSQESLQKSADPQTQEAVKNLSGEVETEQDYQEKLNELTSYNELLKNLKPEFSAYLEKEYSEFFSSLSMHEKPLIELTLWNELMKTQSELHFSQMGENIFGVFQNFFDKEKKSDAENIASKNTPDIIEMIKKEFDATLGAPIKKITQYKKENPEKNFTNISQVEKIISGKEKTDEVFFKEIQKNQKKFLEQFAEKKDISESGEKFLELLNKSGPLKNSITTYIETLSKIPLVGTIFAFIFGENFLQKLKEPYNPASKYWENFGTTIKNLPQNGYEKIKTLWETREKNPEDEQKSIKKLKNQAKKADIDIDEKTFWSQIFSADENDTGFFGQLKKNIFSDIEKTDSDDKKFFYEKFSSFHFEKTNS